MRKIVSKLVLPAMAALVALSVGAASPASIVAAQGAGDVFLSTPVPGVIVDKGKPVTFSVDVNNNTTIGKTVDLTLATAPEGWQPILKDRGFVVRQVWVAAGKSESVDLQVTAPSDAKSQDYEFLLKGSGQGVDTSLKLLVGVKDKTTTKSTNLNVQYPTLQGKSGTKFEFKADLANNSEGDRSYGLSVKAPDGWNVWFQPSYETKQISSVQVKSGSTQGLDIEVQSPNRVAAGEYPITVTASTGSDRFNADLKVTVTGDYQMAITTRTGQFNTSATAGENSPFYVIVTNSGSAPLQNLSLSSTKPEGWQVTFSPDKIDNLDPGAQREVAMTLKPSAKAIAGDYMLTVTANHPQVSLDRDVRVTVETPSLWGWLGLGILVVVIGGLLGVFMKIGRR